jgi:hypothetical protein
MTLLVSALTQDCVWQVADRRLIDVRTGRPVSIDTNKAIHFARAMLFAYTGPAELEGKATATWIADRLSAGGDPEACLTSLQQGLERAISVIRRADLRAFAVDGVGWGLDRLTGTTAPRLLRFSNCINEDGVWTGTLQDGIRTWDGSLKPHVALHMRAAGQPVPLAIGRHWERQIRRRVAGRAPVADIGRCPSRACPRRSGRREPGGGSRSAAERDPAPCNRGPHRDHVGEHAYHRDGDVQVLPRGVA